MNPVRPEGDVGASGRIVVSKPENSSFFPRGLLRKSLSTGGFSSRSALGLTLLGRAAETGVKGRSPESSHGSPFGFHASPKILLIVGQGALLLGVASLFLYDRYWHPAWRKERSLVEACREAFGTDGCLLEGLYIHRGGPMGVDLFSGPGRASGPLPDFTSNVETAGTTPDFSGMNQRQVHLVRRYLHSHGAMPHYEREVLHPDGDMGPSTRNGRPNEGEGS